MIELYSKMFQAVMPANIEGMASKEKGTVRGGIMALFLAWIIGLALAIVGIFLTVGNVSAQLEPVTALFGGGVVGGLMVVAMVIVQVLGLFISIISNYVIHFVGSWVAKNFFKGTGNFPQQFYIAMLFSGAIMIMSSLILFALKLVPYLGMVGGIISMLFTLYSLYLTYLTIKAVQKVEVMGAAVTLLVTLLLSVAIAIAAIVLGAMLAVALGLTAAGAAAGGI